MQQGDTISAIATPQGEGGIGVIRISGEHALKTAGKVFRAKNGKPLVMAAAIAPSTAISWMRRARSSTRRWRSS